MRIAICMLTHKTDGFKNIIYLLIYQIIVGHTVDDQSFGNDITYRHTRIERCNRILKYHLDLCDQLALLRNAVFLLIFFIKRLDCRMIAVCSPELLVIFCVKRLDARLGILSVDFFAVNLCVSDLRSVISDNGAKLVVDLFDPG